MRRFTFTVAASTVARFDGGLSFLEDVALDDFNVDVTRVDDAGDRLVLTVAGTDKDIAAFITYLKP